MNSNFKFQAPVYNNLCGFSLWRKAIDASSPLAIMLGSFRILHPGNLRCAALAAAEYKNLCAIIEPESEAAGETDYSALYNRAALLACVKGISAVAVFPEKEPRACLQANVPFILADCLFQTPKTYLQKTARNLAESIHDIEPLKGCFTGDIIAAIRSNRTPITPDDVQQLPPLMDENEIDKTLAGLKGKKIVTVNGCFDILHPGHMRLLAEARQKGDALIALANDDESVRRYKGANRPVFSLQCRLAALNALKPVTAAFAFSGDTPLAMLEKIRPAIHVKGGSFAEERVRQEKNMVESRGGRIEFVPMVGNFSTSGIIAELNKT